MQLIILVTCLCINASIR